MGAAYPIGFQSTPPAEARGDFEWSRAMCAELVVSIHSPPPKRGETRRCHVELLNDGVSIHSPRRSEGRPHADGNAPSAYR